MRASSPSSLRVAPLSQRVFATAVLVTLGIGFGLSLVYLWAREIRPHRQQGRKMVEGVIYTYHGAPEMPRLVAALHGSMAPFVNDEELAAIEDWVERGKAPARFEASHGTSGRVDRTRPLCPYPQVARYSGTGSIDDAANFTCKAP